MPSRPNCARLFPHLPCSAERKTQQKKDQVPRWPHSFRGYFPNASFPTWQENTLPYDKIARFCTRKPITARHQVRMNPMKNRSPKARMVDITQRVSWAKPNIDGLTCVSHPDEVGRPTIVSSWDTPRQKRECVHDIQLQTRCSFTAVAHNITTLPI